MLNTASFYGVMESGLGRQRGCQNLIFTTKRREETGEEKRSHSMALKMSEHLERYCEH